MRTLLSHGVDPEAFRWDWYQGTLRVPEFAHYPERLVDALGEALGAQSAESVRAQNGYTDATVLRRNGDVIARVNYGGRNLWPNALATSEHAQTFAPVLRRWPHHVTRADVAYDVDAPNAFETLVAECLAVADERGVSVSHAGDWHRGEKGRTVYLGARSSEVFCRVYEKGKEQKGKAVSGQVAAKISGDWARLEIEVKPKRQPRRVMASQMEPAAFLGWSIWTKVLAERVLGLDVPRLERVAWVQSEDERLIAWMARQWGPTMRRRAESLGGQDALWDEIRRQVWEGGERGA